MPAEIYPSTKALSAYNMLSMSRKDLSVAELVDELQEHFDPEVDAVWVAEGVAFLVANGFAVERDGKVAPVRPRAPDGKAWPLRRANENKELRFA